MLPCDGPAICKPERSALEQALRILAVVTMLMTVPQVIAVWTHPNAGGFVLVSWATYLVSSIAWLACMAARSTSCPATGAARSPA